MHSPTQLRTFAILGMAVLTVTACGSGGNGPLPVGDLPSEARNSEDLYISWEENTIDDESRSGDVPLRGADGLQMADLDQDGYLDIVSVHEDSDHLRVAYGSDDPTDWFRLSLGEGAEVDAVEDVALGDVNGDGFIDAIAACEKGHLIYLQNPANKIRGWRWDRVIPEVTRGRGSFIRVFLADIDGDGKLEAVASNKGSGRTEEATAAKPKTEISWFDPPDDPLSADGWTEHVLTLVDTPINAQPFDLDGDGDLDIFAGSRGESRVFWFENQGPGDDGVVVFAEHPVEADLGANASTLGEARFSGFNLAFHDFNSDGRIDVVIPAMPNAVGWLEQPADPTNAWRFHLIGSIEPDELVSVTLADITGNGQPDLMTGAYSRGPRDNDGPDVGAFSNPRMILKCGRSRPGTK
ncbi:MAG: VCBS repeat-containing protein [Acidobacteria bacterium]|nr:VCBS repeat-containing protein [Acidobacteriota bacterium]